jgi:hypothetical protein
MARAGRFFREAGDGARTRDTWLGKPVLYQLSYSRAGKDLSQGARKSLRRHL